VDENKRVEVSNSATFTVLQGQVSCTPPSAADLQDNWRRPRRLLRCSALCACAVAAAKPFTATIH